MSLAAVLIPVALSWAVIFRTTQVLMFAVGEFALIGAYLFYTLDHTHSVNWWLALVLAASASAAIGAVMFALVLRRL